MVKPLLTDALMKQTGMVEEGFSMDVNTLEQERGNYDFTQRMPR